MKLNVKDRLVLLGILPKEGDFITLKIVRELQGLLSFTEEEVKVYKFDTAEGFIKWDAKADVPIEVKIGAKAKEIISDAFKEMDKQKKLTLEHINIYERFIKG